MIVDSLMNFVVDSLEVCDGAVVFPKANGMTCSGDLLLESRKNEFLRIGMISSIISKMS